MGDGGEVAVPNFSELGCLEEVRLFCFKEERLSERFTFGVEFADTCGGECL